MKYYIYEQKNEDICSTESCNPVYIGVCYQLVSITIEQHAFLGASNWSFNGCDHIEFVEKKDKYLIFAFRRLFTGTEGKLSVVGIRRSGIYVPIQFYIWLMYNRIRMPCTKLHTGHAKPFSLTNCI